MDATGACKPGGCRGEHPRPRGMREIAAATDSTKGRSWRRSSSAPQDQRVSVPRQSPALLDPGLLELGSETKPVVQCNHIAHRSNGML